MTHITKNLRIGWRQIRHSLIFPFIELAENKMVQNKRITMTSSIVLYKPNISKLAYFISDFDWKDTIWSLENVKGMQFLCLPWNSLRHILGQWDLKMYYWYYFHRNYFDATENDSVSNHIVCDTYIYIYIYIKVSGYLGYF